MSKVSAVSIHQQHARPGEREDNQCICVPKSTAIISKTLRPWGDYGQKHRCIGADEGPALVASVHDLPIATRQDWGGVGRSAGVTFALFAFFVALLS